MLRRIASVFAAFILAPALVLGQALEFSGPLRFDYIHDNSEAQAPILVSDLGGAVCVSATTTSVTCRNASGTEYIATITGSGGGSITSGTADPTGGNAGDAYIQVDASDVIQSIWLNVSGTWSEFTIPAAGTSTDDQTAAEVNTDTTNFTGLLDTADITVQAALDSLDDITPARTLQTGTPSNIAAVSATGTAEQVSREDHVHGGQRALATTIPEDVADTGTVGTSNSVARSDHVHGGASGMAGADDQTASEVNTDTSGFAGILSTTDTTVQTALNTLDDVRSTDLPDMPSAIEDRKYLRGNGTTNYDLVDEPTNPNTIPHVGRIPAVSDSSPTLVYLTHDELDGDREDVTLTIGLSGVYCGYSDGDLFPTFGALTGMSPLTSIFGIYNTTTNICQLSEIYSANEGFLDDLAQIVFTINGTAGSCNLGSRDQSHGVSVKRILNCSALETLALGDITINFLYIDGSTAYWTDGSTVHRAGLYEKVGTPPTYHDLAPPEDAHKTGEGSAACGASSPPTAAGQICVTSDGRGYFAMPRDTLITTPAAITSQVGESIGYFLEGLSPIDLENDGENGQFIWVSDDQIFYQRQGTNYVTVTWSEVWTFIVSVDDTPANRAYMASVFLGEFASQAEATIDRDGYSDDSPTYYFLYAQFSTLIRIDGFTHSVRETIDEDFAWRGPVIISEEVLDIISANSTESVDRPLDSLQVGNQLYSVVVRPGSDGHLREPAAADFDDSIGKSKVVGYDGDWKEVGRTLIDAHSASATDNLRDDGFETTLDGRTWHYRGEHWQDYLVSNKMNFDYYYNLNTHTIRWCFTTNPPAGCLWSNIHSDSGHWDGQFYQTLKFIGYFESRDEALAHVTEDGQSAVYRNPSGGYLFNTFTSVVTAEAGHYEYDWRLVNPPYVPEPIPTNVDLVSDSTYGWSTANGPSQEVHFSRALTEDDDGRPIHIDWREWASTDPGANYRDTGVTIFAEHVRRLTELAPIALAKAVGGRTAIDRTTAITNSRVPGAVTFKFPQSGSGHPLSDMRLIYIGDHIDDVDESLDDTDTNITVDSSTDMMADTNYWIVGPVSNCSTTYHSEKITITNVVDADNVTATRGVDSTALPSGCLYAPGADVIEDNKTYFTLQATHADQDNAVMSFTLLAQGISTGTSVQGFETSPVGSMSTSFTTSVTNWSGTGVTLPIHANDVWIIIHINNGEWHWNHTMDYSTTTAGVSGQSVAANQIWDTFLEFFPGNTQLRFVRFGISATRELLIHTQNISLANASSTLDSVEVRLVH